MNIIYVLTLRNLKQNKKRTLVTMIGVIISVAMVTAITTLAFSLVGLLEQQSIESAGNWHVLYKNVDKDQLEVIKHDKATKKLFISLDRFAFLKGNQNANRPFLLVKKLNAEGLKDFPVQLIKGRLPQNNNELVVSEEVATNAHVNYHLGDHVTLGIRNKPSLAEWKALQTFTIVGFMKRPGWEPKGLKGYTTITYLDERLIPEKSNFDVQVLVKKINRSLFTHAENLAEQNNIQAVEFNTELLDFYGVTQQKENNSSKVLYFLCFIVLSVILIGSIFLIYTAFSMSVSERTRHLGMLSSVGATNRQKKNTVLFEGAIIGAISIPLGIISGLSGTALSLLFINSTLDNLIKLTSNIKMVVTPASILISIVVSIATIFISTYIPARKAAGIAAIDAIRQTTEIKRTGESMKTSRLIRKLFGIEAEISLKNLKRNKRRYRGTVISLIISIVLFLVVSFFTAAFANSFKSTPMNIDYDFSIPNINNVNEEKAIESLHDVTEYNLIKSIYGWSTSVNESLFPDELQPWIRKIWMNNKGEYLVPLNIDALQDDKLKSFAHEIGADYELLQNPDHLSAILLNVIKLSDKGTNHSYNSKAFDVNIGDTLTLKLGDFDKYGVPIKIAGMMTQPKPTGTRDSSRISLVVSEKVFEKLKDNTVRQSLYLKSSNPTRTLEEITAINNQLYIEDNSERNRRNEWMILVLQLFGFGFVALISAISMANIFNTLSTSISLRRREFAMLKSMGMEPKSFVKMIYFESIWYGVTSLAYGLPISIAIMYLMYRGTSFFGHKYGLQEWKIGTLIIESFSRGFVLPWLSIIVVIAAVFMLLFSIMLYASAKVRKANIIDSLKQENIIITIADGKSS